MRHYTKFWLIALIAGLFASCADDDLQDYPVQKPGSLAVLEYLNQYDVLKSYVDRSASPNFKLGAGVDAADFNNQGGIYSLVTSNFDEVTAGWAMKHGAVVQEGGIMDLNTVTDFVESAQAMGVTIYGHTLCWHENQNSSYLNSLIAPIIIPGENKGNLFDLTDLQDGSFGEWGRPNVGNGITIEEGMGMEDNTPAIKLVASDNSPEFYSLQLRTPSIPAVLGHTYEVSYYVRSEGAGEGNVTSNGLQDNYRGKDYLQTGVSGWSYPTNSSWQEIRFTINDFLDPTFALDFNFGFVPGMTYYIDVNTLSMIDLNSSGFTLGDNMISNADFENGSYSPWILNGGSNGATIGVTQNGSGAGNTGYALSLSNPSETANNYDVQLTYRFDASLVEGETYYFTFDVKADANVTAGTQCHAGLGEYADGFIGDVDFTTEWTTKEVTFTPARADIRGIVFDLGKNATTYYFDNLVFAKEDTGGTIEKTDEEKAEIIGEALETWIAAMMEVTKDYVTTWDVVNEPMSDWPDATQLKTGIGSDLADGVFYWQDYLGKDYAAIAFKLAREYGNESDILFMNDYGLESNLTKCQGLIDFVKYTEQRGARVDGIGTQMHISINTDKANIARMFEMLAATGKLIKVSELDIVLEVESPTDEQLKAQYDMYRYVVETYKEKIPASQQYGITIWSPLDSPNDSSWLPGEQIGLWTLDYYRKRAYAGVADGLAGKTVFEE